MIQDLNQSINMMKADENYEINLEEVKFYQTHKTIKEIENPKFYEAKLK